MLLLDSADRYAYAGASAGGDAESIRDIGEELCRLWPRHALYVNRCVPGTDWLADGVTDPPRSPYFTDVMRLRDAVPATSARLVVVRPAALLLPGRVLRRLVTLARRQGLDVATLAGVPTDVVQVVSREALEVLAAAGPVPRCVTVADAVERLLGVSGPSPGRGLKARRVAPAAVEWADEHLARGLPPDAWKAVPGAAVLACDSAVRLVEATGHVRRSVAAARASLEQWRGSRRGTSRGRQPVLVTVPSMFQSGANNAWEEVSAHLSPHDVAFVVGRATALGQVLTRRGFTVFETGEAPAARSVAAAAAFLEALATVAPRVVHFDGIEGNGWAPLAFSRGARVVQHVRLNDVDRFQPAFGYADAIVTVSEVLRRDVAARVGEATRVEHVPDGICLDARRRATPRRNVSVADTVRTAAGEATPGGVSCLCVGRVEPEKGQLRVLDIVEALSAHLPCRLVLLGSCGSDPAYCDEVTRRILSAPDRVRATWHSFTHPIARYYDEADVVLVASRNEALGMVGIEALAAGCLLVAQRSTGYAVIVDASRGEGLLFDADEEPSAIAARILPALAEAASFAVAAKRKVESAFDARTTAHRLTSLWQDLAARA